MNNKSLGALLCAILLIVSSCGEDYLYKAPQGSIDKTALANAQGVDMLVTSAYASFLGGCWGGSIQNWTFGGIYGGDNNKGSDTGDQAVLNELETYRVSNTNSYINEKWNFTYQGSKRVALALQVMADAKDMDPKIKDIRQGELYFIRAIIYFDAVRVFGPFIPFVDETYTDNDPKIHNDKDIYANIMTDVDNAIRLLPKKPAELGRAYYWAAVALKAKILMQQGKMADAKPLLADLLANGTTASGKKYGLADNLTDNWSTFTDNTSPESIFEIQFSSDGNNHGNGALCLGYPHNSGPGGCCGFFQPSFWLANSFQVDANGLPYLNNEFATKPSVTTLQPPGGKVTLLSDGKTIALSLNDPTIAVDPRLDFSIGRVNIPYKDWGPAQNWVRDYTNGGLFLPKKHVFSKAEKDAGFGRSNMYDGWAPGSAMNVQYLSVRDAMLLYAECLANDGQLSEAMGLVNQIRNRAALPVNIIKQADGTPAANYKVSPYPSSHAAFTDKATCIKAIRMERKLELAMESTRWFDLTRWGGDYMSQEIGAYLAYEQKFIDKFAGVPTLSPARTMFPIPLTQIQAAGNDETGAPYLVQPAPWKE